MDGEKYPCDIPWEVDGQTVYRCPFEGFASESELGCFAGISNPAAVNNCHIGGNMRYDAFYIVEHIENLLSTGKKRS